MKKLFIAALVAATCASCTDREDSLDDARSILQVSAALKSDTRAIEDGTEFTEPGKEIGVSLFDQATGQGYENLALGYMNVPYVSEKSTTGGGRKLSWSSSSPIVLSPTEGKAVAYYPYAAGTNIKSIPVETASQTDYMYSDWVTGISSVNPKASFQMNHALCAVQVDIVNESYVTPDTPGQVTSVSVTSSKLATGASLDITAAAAGPAQSGLSAFTGAGQAIVSNDPFKISQTSHSTRLLAVPMDGQGDLTVRVVMDGKTYAVPVTNVPAAFQQGKNYIVSLTAKGGEAPFALNSVAVTNWNEMPLVNPEMNPGKFEEIDQYVVKIEVPRDNFTFYSNVYGFTGVIDWGDGNSISYDTPVQNPQYVYKKKGTYFVIAKGKCDYLNYDEFVCRSSAKIVTDIVYIGSGLGIFGLRYAFSGCSNLRILRKGIFDNLTEVTDFRGTFSDCTGLQSIPAGLFDKNVNVTDFRETFRGCTGLQSIPARLFDKNVNVTSFYETFRGCSGLRSIPAGLFDSCTQVTSFEGTFERCSGLRSIPAGLFDKCTQVTSFWRAFWDCSGLQSIPAGLFDKCTQVWEFTRTFCGCSSLQSIPQGLFDKNVNVTDFRETFCGCRSLQSIPQGLFDKNVNATDFYGTFSGCRSLQSIPQGLFDKCTQVTEFGNTFGGCWNLQSIPTGLFDKCTQVWDFRETFNGCSGLTSIPAGLFDKCTQVWDFSATFWDCSSLQSIPQGLFDKCTQVTGFEGTFWDCSGLRSIPAGLFDKNVNVTDFRETFRGCTGLQSIPAGLFDKNVNVTDFRETFRGCTGLQSIPQGLFDKNVNVIWFDGTFWDCSGLQNIPVGLFDKCTEVWEFTRTFCGCSGLQNIPVGLFDKCIWVTDFRSTFEGCTSLTGESPYTEVYDEKQQKKVKVHLYERRNYPTIFTAPTSFSYCFRYCSGLEDYKNNAIPSTWR